MAICTRRGTARAFWAVALWLLASRMTAQQPDPAAIIRTIDAAVQARYESVLAFTDIEHYAVFRGSDQAHPVAEMTVKDSYRKGEGKTYTVLSESGSAVVQKFGLKPLLQNEELINQPDKVAQSWFTSANYHMELDPGGPQLLNGRACFALTIYPYRKAPNMIDGTLWADARDGSIAQIDGIASKSPSIFARTTHMMRQYEQMDGFPMARRARAESNSLLFGHTVVIIDYSDYHLQLRNGK